MANDLDDSPRSSIFDRDAALATVQRWRGLLDTQMHFNSMLMQVRAIGVSIVIAVFGAAAVAVAQYPQQLINLPSTTIHIAAVVIVFGLLLLLAVFVLDYFYYYPMLLSVVACTHELEQESCGPNGAIALNLSGRLSKDVPPTRATAVLLVFYGIPLLSGLLFLLYLATLGPS
jgi:hypothetical protein